jgi:hypothetical protein
MSSIALELPARVMPKLQAAGGLALSIVIGVVGGRLASG